MENTCIVYVLPDSAGRILAVHSGAFLRDPMGWTPVDSGAGQRYYHAQGYYFPLPLRDEHGVCRYKLDHGQPAARTPEEMEADRAALPAPSPSPEERIAALEAAGLERDAALIELAALLAGGE